MMIKVKVKPNSGEQKIEKKVDYYFVGLKSKAEDNKANVELCKLLQRYFKRKVRIKRGLSSRNKIIEVEE
jgi:uncharacterized protein (TIGR00251 family)